MKNKILKTIIAATALIFILSVCLVDSESYIPFAVACISFGVLILFGYANKERIMSYARCI